MWPTLKDNRLQLPFNRLNSLTQNFIFRFDFMRKMKMGDLFGKVLENSSLQMSINSMESVSGLPDTKTLR